jgi:drug/metabolite transporter (DMT)-like permease
MAHHQDVLEIGQRTEPAIELLLRGVVGEDVDLQGLAGCRRTTALKYHLSRFSGAHQGTRVAPIENHTPLFQELAQPLRLLPSARRKRSRPIVGSGQGIRMPQEVKSHGAINPQHRGVSTRLNSCYTKRVRAEISFRLAFAGLIAGAVGIAFAPLFVRWSEVGPAATAFHRLLMALPILVAWQAWFPFRDPGPESTFTGTPPPIPTRSGLAAACPADLRDFLGLALPGLFFAGDLALWHWSIRLTSVANATLFANFAPILVTIAARILFHERIRPLFLVGLLLASTGAILVVGSSANLTQRHVLGDLLGLATALFYAAYLLSVKHVRRRHPTLVVMLWSSLSACPVLGVIALISGELLIPHTALGWGVLVALAVVSQVAGQGLIAFAFRHLPASFSSVSLLTQPVVAALLAWAFLGESLDALQAMGGFVVLLGIALASTARR